MGLGGISIWQLLIVLLIVVLLFGTKKLKGLGSDLGGAVKGFKKALDDSDKDDNAIDEKQPESQGEQAEKNQADTEDRK